MLQHFWHPSVFITYGCAIALNCFGVTSLEWGSVLAQTLILVAVDYTVHRQNHKWEWLAPPYMSVGWAVGLAVASAYGFIHLHSQMAAILFAQMWWDNSWHSVQHHRHEGEPRTHTDHVLIRWGSLALAALTAFMSIIRR